MGALSTLHLQSAHPGGFELFDWKGYFPPDWQDIIGFSTSFVHPPELDTWCVALCVLLGEVR